MQQLEALLIQAIKEDLSTPILRYYLQEEAFVCDPKSPQSLFQLPFNQIAAEVVAEVILSNNQITSNSRVATNLLQNGKQIFRNKKLEYFNAFKAEYKLIGEAIQSLGIEQRSVFQYSVLAISNLILKLSLNMSRISIILIAKLFTASVLNPFMTAILFEKFLEKQHFKSKEGCRMPEDHLNLLKQFPKISIIKVSHKRNPFDRENINKSQNLFGSEAHNVQFIELYEREEQFLVCFENQDNKNSYNMTDLFGLSMPFEMEFYLFFSEIIVPKMQIYKPDIVIYYQDLQCETQLGMNSEIKGLIINIISQKIQNKIYVFKQFGLTTDSLIISKNVTKNQQQPNLIDLKQKSNLWTTQDQDLVISQQKCKQLGFKLKDLFVKNCIQMKEINRLVAETKKTEINAKKMKALFKISKDTKTSELQISIKKMRKFLFNDLSYISLALLQKSNFLNLNSALRNYIFPTAFLKNFIDWIKMQLEKLSKTKNFSDEMVSLEKKLYMLEGMLQISELCSDEATNAQMKTANYYNFVSKRVQVLTQWTNNQLKIINVGKNDQTYYHYTKTHVLLFLFSTSAKIYAKRCSDAYFICLREDQYLNDQQKLQAKYSTLVSNNKYFYKAFGEYETKPAQGSYICILNIESIEKLKNKDAVKWTYLKDCKHQTGRVKIQHKKWGWGISIDLKDSSLVILGGGYNYKVQNEQKVNKFFYIISNYTEVQKTGKINPQKTNLQENLKRKNIITPCIYGIPLLNSQGELTVLNTNGYNQQLNHHKKMFLTKIKVAAKDQIYILAQNKMDYNATRPEEAIANKNAILSYMIGSYNQTNRYEGVASLCDSEGRLKWLKIDENEAKDIVRVQSVPKQTSEMCEQNTVYHIAFQSNRLIMSQDDKKLFVKKLLL